MAECYMCSRPGPTTEHVPPKCFFPELKDLPEVDLRKNLLTVPACDLHNTAKVKDDEYLLALITAHHGNNPTAYSHYATKIMRALTKNPGLAGKMAQDHRRIELEGEPSFALRVDIERFNNAMSHIARAIHFKHAGSKWLEPIQILAPPIRGDDLRPRIYVHELVASWVSMISEVPKSGENQDVFYYRLGHVAGGAITLLQLCFFGGFEVLALSGSSINGIQP